MSSSPDKGVEPIDINHVNEVLEDSIRLNARLRSALVRQDLQINELIVRLSHERTGNIVLRQKVNRPTWRILVDRWLWGGT